MGLGVLCGTCKREEAFTACDRCVGFLCQTCVKRVGKRYKRFYSLQRYYCPTCEVLPRLSLGGKKKRKDVTE